MFVCLRFVVIIMMVEKQVFEYFTTLENLENTII